MANLCIYPEKQSCPWYADVSTVMLDFDRKSTAGHNAKEKVTLLRVIPTMTCWVEVVRWGLSSSSRSEAVWEWIQDSMGCQFVEELRFVSASRPPPRLRQQHQQLLTKFHFHITPVIHLPLFSILRLNTPKPNPNVILCAHRVSILSITKFSLHIHLCQPDRVRWG